MIGKRQSKKWMVCRSAEDEIVGLCEGMRSVWMGCTNKLPLTIYGWVVGERKSRYMDDMGMDMPWIWVLNLILRHMYIKNPFLVLLSRFSRACLKVLKKVLKNANRASNF